MIDIDFSWTNDIIPFLKFLSAHSLRVFMLLALGWALAIVIRRYLKRGLEKIPQIEPEIRYFIVSLVYYMIFSVTVILTLAEIGVQTATLTTVIGAAGLAIGLALQGTLANIAAGIMLLVLRPFRIGDEIAAGEIQGYVSVIGLFTTELITIDGIFVSAPNSQIWSRTIVNYSRLPTRRFDASFAIAIEEDVEKVKTIVLQFAQKNPQILLKPAPVVYVTEVVDGHIRLILRGWTNSDTYASTRFSCQQGIHTTLRQAGVSCPVPLLLPMERKDRQQ
jgi:small conductance mechanosensitive channel